MMFPFIVFSKHLTLLERAIVIVILSFCLSVKRLDCDKMKKVLPRFLYHIKEHLP